MSQATQKFGGTRARITSSLLGISQPQTYAPGDDTQGPDSAHATADVFDTYTEDSQSSSSGSSYSQVPSSTAVAPDRALTTASGRTSPTVDSDQSIALESKTTFNKLDNVSKAGPGRPLSFLPEVDESSDMSGLERVRPRMRQEEHSVSTGNGRLFAPRTDSPSVYSTRKQDSNEDRSEVGADIVRQPSTTSLRNMIDRATKVHDRLISSQPLAHTRMRSNGSTYSESPPYESPHDTYRGWHVDSPMISEAPAHLRSAPVPPLRFHNHPPFNPTPDCRDSIISEKQQRRSWFCRFEMIFIIVVLLIVAIAAVITALLLTVFREQRKQMVDDKLAHCKTSMPCQNGGSSALTKTMQCSCACLTPYIGTRCEVKQVNPKCLTIQSGDLSQSIGCELPQHFSMAQQFGYSLDSQAVLRAFNQTSTPCQLQNELVTINGSAVYDVNKLQPTVLKKRDAVRIHQQLRLNQATHQLEIDLSLSDGSHVMPTRTIEIDPNDGSIRTNQLKRSAQRPAHTSSAIANTSPHGQSPVEAPRNLESFSSAAPVPSRDLSPPPQSKPPLVQPSSPGITTKPLLQAAAPQETHSLIPSITHSPAVSPVHSDKSTMKAQLPASEHKWADDLKVERIREFARVAVLLTTAHRGTVIATSLREHLDESVRELNLGDSVSGPGVSVDLSTFKITFS